MVRVVYDESEQATQVLSSKAKKYVNSIVKEAIEEDPNVDCELFARVIAGELEECGMVSGEDPHEVLLDIKAAVRVARSKNRHNR